MKRGRIILHLARLLALLALGLFLVWLFGKNAIARSLVEKEMDARTTCAYEIGDVGLSLGGRVLTLRDVVLVAPNVPSDAPMLVIDKLVATVRPDSVFSPPLQLEALDIDVREFHIRRTADGTCNLDAIYPGASGLLPPPPKGKPTSPKGPSAPEKSDALAPTTPDEAPSAPMSLDSLRLAFALVSLDDRARRMKFTLKPNNKARVFDQTYTDVESADVLQPKIEADLRATLGLF